MKKSLRSSVERYSQEETSISPISSLDAEIIVELGQIFDKLHQPELKSMIDEWKTLPDVKIRDMLLDWNTNHPKEVQEKKKKKEKEEFNPLIRRFVDFGGKSMDVSAIKTVEKDLVFNEKERVAQHCVIFNRGFDGAYGDIYFYFNTERLCSQGYDNLKILLEKTNTIEFI